jgi:hypothetical protein
VYEVRQAAAQNSTLHEEKEFEGCKFRITAGDYQELLQKVNGAELFSAVHCIEKRGVIVFNMRYAAVQNAVLH